MKIKLTLIMLSLLIFLGCDDLSTKSDGIYDDDLITAIIESEQEDIAIEEMPALSRSTINQDYNDFIEMDARMAPNLGYQVSMDGKNYKPGDHNEVYFNLKGRKLIPRKGKHNRDRFKCFELILPVTFIMSDGTSIVIENESDYGDVKTWYINNPDFRKKPDLQYPVNIIYKDGITEIINDDEEMRSIKDVCRKRDDKKYWDCFKIEYPVTFILDDGSTISMVDSEGWAELKTWHEANPDSGRPILQYPVVIIYHDGTVETINNDEEMRIAKENCRD